MNRKLYSLCLLIFVMMLASCGDISSNDALPDKKEHSSSQTSEVKEFPNDTFTEPSSDILESNKYWYKNNWFRGTSNTNNLLSIKGDNEDDLIICSAHTLIAPFEVDSAEIVNDDTLGMGIRYTYEYTANDGFPYLIALNYFPADKKIILIMTGSPFTGSKYDFSDVYEYDSELTLKMCNITDSDTKNAEMNTDETDSITHDTWYKDNPRYIYSSPNSSDETVICFYDDNGLMLKIGDEASIPLYYKHSINGYEGYPNDDAESHIMITFIDNDKIELLSSGRYGQYCGEYMRLFDETE